MDGSKRRWLGRALGLAVAVLLAWGPPQAPARAQAPAQGGDVVVFAAASLKNALDEVAAACGRRRPARRRRSPMRRARRWPSRSSRARRPTSSSPPTSTGWTISREQEPDQARHALQPARQPHRADRAQGFQGARARRSSRASTSPGCWAAAGSPWPTSTPCRPASTARRRSRSSASGTASKGKRRAGRERARRAAAGRRAARRRSASSTRPMPRPSPSVKIVGTFPEDTHPPIIYPVALTQGSSERRRARPSSTSCSRAKAQPLFEKQGFTVLAPASN